MCGCGCEQNTGSLLFDTPGTLGFDWGALAGQAAAAGVQTGLGLLFGGGRGGGSGCLQGQVSGDQAMTNCVPRVMALFDEVESYIGIAPPEAIIEQANAVAAIFSDPRYFDQSIGGRSREIREAAKAAGRARADAIIALVGGTVPTTGVTPGAPAAATPAANTLQIDTKTVLIVGGGLLVMVMLLRG